MDRRERRPAVLVVSERRSDVDVMLDAVAAVEGTALFVPDFDRALCAIRTGFAPDVVVVDLGYSTAAVYAFLRSLFEDPVARKTPVLGTSRRKRALFQLAPRDAQREVPFPSSPAVARALIGAVASG